MPYIARDANNNIVGVFKEPTEHATEKMDGQSADLYEFMVPASSATEAMVALSKTDLGMARVLEDLIAILVERNVMAITDLPEAAMEKILRRQSYRQDVDSIGGIVS